jgi:hypothetical protein
MYPSNRLLMLKGTIILGEEAPEIAAGTRLHSTRTMSRA